MDEIGSLVWKVGQVGKGTYVAFRQAGVGQWERTTARLARVGRYTASQVPIYIFSSGFGRFCELFM